MKYVSLTSLGALYDALELRDDISDNAARVALASAMANLFPADKQLLHSLVLAASFVNGTNENYAPFVNALNQPPVER